MKKNKLLVCTFSGGRTSAFMGLFLKDYEKYKDYDKLFIYANTGKELPKTLGFINRCDKEWGLNLVWVEARINIELGIGTTYNWVTYTTASRNGEPFESMMEKYPMPNVFASNCTRELKLAPINKYVKSLLYDEVITAMGIRADEEHRRSNFAKENNLIYPLIDDIKVDERFIRNFWDRQRFDLGIKDYEGNCDLCFKKSERKRLTIIKENPEIASWWLNMENKYRTEKIPRFDLRTNLSIEQLIQKSRFPFQSIKDKHELHKLQSSLFDEVSDYETDCFCKAN